MLSRRLAHFLPTFGSWTKLWVSSPWVPPRPTSNTVSEGSWFHGCGGGLRSAERGKLISGGHESVTLPFICRSRSWWEEGGALESMDKSVDGWWWWWFSIDKQHVRSEPPIGLNYLISLMMSFASGRFNSNVAIPKTIEQNNNLINTLIIHIISIPTTISNPPYLKNKKS